MKYILTASLWCVDRMRRLRDESEGSVFVEYLLLLTLVGIGAIAGLAAVRTALINELLDLAAAINAISCP
jgi:Flp pilus assembly pilin Flp